MARKTSFYYSFLVLPREPRQAIVAVWDFCRAVDDAVDESAGGPREAPEGSAAEPSRRGSASGGGAPRAGENAGGPREAVRFWREEIARCYAGDPPATTEGRRLQPFVLRYQLPRQAFEDVIDGVAMDLDTTRYETFGDLLRYCHRVASAVGMICIEIFGCRSPQAREYAAELGVALQLTNILRDIPEDLARGRVYLPLADMAAAGCSVADLEAHRVSEPVRRLLEFECNRAHEFYRRAVAMRPEQDRHRLVAAEIMRAVYFETLRRIERSGYDVFSGRARVPRPQQALIALRQWLWQT